MKIAVSQGPIQARMDTENRLERYLSIQIANVFSDLVQNALEEDVEKIDFWNTYCQKIDLQIKKLGIADHKYIEATIKKRHENLDRYFRIDTSNRKLLLDSDTKVSEIIIYYLSELLKKGFIAVNKTKLQTCQSCKVSIAPPNIPIKICKNCGGTYFEVEESEQLILDVGKALEMNSEKVQEICMNKPELNSYFKTLPKFLIISKSRDRGITLENFNLDDSLKVDPKITLALQSFLYREIFNTKLIAVVQGIDSIKNTYPLATILDPTFKANIISVPMLPELKNEGISPVLALALAGKKKKIEAAELDSLKSSSKKLINKLKNCLNYLYNQENELTGDNNEIEFPFNKQILCEKPEQICLLIRNWIFKTVSGTIIPQIKSGEIGFNKELKAKLEKMQFALMQDENSLLY